MTTATFAAGKTPPSFDRPLASDRNAVLAILAVLWIGIAGGFGLDVKDFLAENPPAPWIVHIHGAAFMGWMVLLTLQILLIRRGDAATHRSLGRFGAALAIAMVILGPAAAILSDIRDYRVDHQPPRFLAVQLGSMIVFPILVGAALALRRQPAAHKRLMILAIICIADAGFSRLRGHLLPIHAPHTPIWDFVRLYYANVLLILGWAAYDLITRKRLHPAFVAGAALVVGQDMVAAILIDAPAFNPIALALIGQ